MPDLRQCLRSCHSRVIQLVTSTSVVGEGCEHRHIAAANPINPTSRRPLGAGLLGIHASFAVTTQGSVIILREALETIRGTANTILDGIQTDS